MKQDNFLHPGDRQPAKKTFSIVEDRTESVNDLFYNMSCAAYGFFLYSAASIFFSNRKHSSG